MHQGYAAQAAPTISVPALHLPDVVRGVMLLLGVGVLANFTVLNEHLLMGAVGWIAFLGSAGVAIAAAVRIIMVDAVPSREPSRLVQRTRQSGIVTEIVLVGVGALFLLAPAIYLVIGTSQEVWNGRAEASDLSAGALAFSSLFGVLGFFMTFWRPQFLLDASRRKITRYAFGRSIPLTKEMPYANLAVYSEGYFITNTGHRLGDMIRGRIGKYTFELEMLHGSLAPEAVQARAWSWASALGATYLTPEQAVQAELAA